VESHLLSSKYVAGEFNIQVMRPVHRQGESTRFPVVYVTDGNFSFDVIKGISHSIQKSGCDAPRFIVVGIGYPGDSPAAGSLLRVRDLTFPGYPEFSRRPPAMEGVLTAPAGTRDFCGGADFQLFMARELIPFIDRTYAVIPEERTYFGHSAGGGFGLFTLFTMSALFRNYIISSPGLAFDGETSAGVRYQDHNFMAKIAEEFIASGRSLQGVKLYLSVGSVEEFESSVSQWRLTSSCLRLMKLLRSAAIEGLELATELLPGESHMTVWPLAFMHGIQAVFGTRIRS